MFVLYFWKTSTTFGPFALLLHARVSRISPSREQKCIVSSYPRPLKDTCLLYSTVFWPLYKPEDDTGQEEAVGQRSNRATNWNTSHAPELSSWDSGGAKQKLEPSRGPNSLLGLLTMTASLTNTIANILLFQYLLFINLLVKREI